jgi:hypothetical protein
MTTNLPPGPYRNDSGPIRDAEGIIIADVYGRGDIPGSHSAIADLMIRAEREADQTPLTPEMMPATLKVNAGWFLDFDWHCKKCTVFIRYETGGDGCGWNAVELTTLNTMGEFRTLCRLFGIEVNG